MRISPAGLEHLAQSEGRSAFPYQDSAGLWTLGVGHRLTPSDLSSGKVYIASENRSADYRHGLRVEDMDALLGSDLAWVEETLTAAVHVPLTQHQADALLCLVFNIGTQAFKQSTLLTRLNAGAYDEVPAQMARWIYAGGKVRRGLRTRRQREISLWLKQES